MCNLYSRAISKPIKPDFAKKKFKTGTSKRYKSSMSGISIPAAAPETEIEEEEDLNVDDIIMKTAEDILNETADQVLRPDVEPEVTTPGNPKSPNLETPVVIPVEEPREVQPENEQEDSADQESEKEQEKDESEPSKDGEDDIPKSGEETAPCSEKIVSDDPMQEDEASPTPAPEIISSYDDDSDDVPITKGMSSSVAARLKMKKARTARKSPVKASTSTPVSYKSRQVNVPRVKTSVQKKKKATPKKKKIAVKKKTPIKKKSTGKRKIDDLRSEERRQEVTDLVPSSERRKISGKKVISNIPPAPLDNISFHFESGASRWRFVYHRKLA